MPLEFLQFVAEHPLPRRVSDPRQAHLAQLCAAAHYLQVEPAKGSGPAVLEIVAVLPEGLRALEIFQSCDGKPSGFLDLS